MDTNDLVKLLPSGYEQACFEKKAITRKRTMTAQTVVFAPDSALHRQSAKKIQKLRTVKNVFPVCAVSYNARSHPAK